MPIPQLSQKTRSPQYWSKKKHHFKKRSKFIYRDLTPSWQRKKRFYTIKGELRKKNLLVVSCWLLAVGCLIGGLSFMVMLAWYSKDLPDPDKLLIRAVAQSTKIYDRTGENILYEVHGEERRTLINLEEIPEYLKKATVVAEDKNFYQHRGFVFLGIIRAFLANLTHGKIVQGASTITQQFVKNAILTSDRTYQRKIKELVLAYQIEKKFTKDKILKMYLNEIPYGSNAYGVEAASQIYFGKSAKDLSLDEATLIAALPKAPTYLSPYGSHQDELIGRQHYILNLMVKEGYLEKEEAEKIKQIDVLKKIKPKKERMIAPHFVMYIKEILTERYGERIVEQGGLKVITTLDLEKQKIAEEAISWGVERNEKKYKASNAAMVALNPKTGQILAMVGSRDYFDDEHEGQVNVALRPRQPGSSFKPIVYSAAFSKGYTPETILFDLVTNFGPSGPEKKNYIPHNYDNKERGPVTIRKALAGSLNIPAVKILYLTGLNNVLDLADRIGYTTLKDRSRFGLALVLGGAEVKLLEHTAAYSVLSQEGIKYDSQAILRIEDSEGKLIEKAGEPFGQKVLDKQIARQVTDILSDNSARAFIFGAQNFLNLGPRPVAAKTGTTNDYRDAWTLGYTPSLAVGVWVGNNDNSPMNKGADGSIVAAPIWHQFMKNVLENTGIEKFNPSSPIKIDKPILNGQSAKEIKVKIDKASGKLATDLTPESQIEEKIYKEVHCILHWVDKDNTQGLAPENPEKDPQYQRWEEAVQKWAKEKGYAQEKPPTESDNLHTQENKPLINIESPNDGITITNSFLDVLIRGSAPRGISRIEFLIDNQIVPDIQLSSTNYKLQATSYLNGSHILTVRAYDDIDNMGQTQINFILSLENNNPIINWLSPANNTSINKNDFPLTLSASYQGPGKIDKIKFYYQKIDAQPFLLGMISQPESLDNLKLIWTQSPESGNYQVFLEVVDFGGNVVQGKTINLLIY
jgi:1A family penicillin-binding protein